MRYIDISEMYRILRRYTLPVHNFQLATSQNNLQRSNRICSFCSFSHVKPIKCYSYGSLRYRTTSANTAILDKTTPKEIKHKLKKYAKLIKVSDQTTTITEAKIKKLNAANVSKFANEPELTLDEIHKIDNRSKRPRFPVSEVKDEQCDEELELKVSPIFDMQEEINVTVPLSSKNLSKEANLPNDHVSEQDVISIKEDLMVMGSSDPATLIKNTSILNTLKDYSQNIMEESNLDAEINPMTKFKKKENILLTSSNKKRTDKLKYQALDQQAKQESFKRSLHSYLDVCVNCGLISQALYTLLYYRDRGKRIHYVPKITDVVLFNTVLQGFALVGNLSKVKEVLNIIVEDSLKPNPQTYAAAFECVGRMTNGKEHRDYLETIVSQMNSWDISLNDILDKSVFIRDQREMVNQGIRILDPDFKAVYTPPDTSYINHLLHYISTTVSQPITPAKGLFTASELIAMGKRQMKLELENQVIVKNIAAQDEPTPLVLDYRKEVSKSEKMWREVVSEALERDIANLKTQCMRGMCLQKMLNIYPYVTILDRHHYVDAIINEIKKLATGSENFSPSLSILARQLGSNIFHKYQIEMKKQYGLCEKMTEIYDEYCNQYLNENNRMNFRTTWQNIVHNQKHKGSTLDTEIVPWPTNILSNLGKFLYNIILRDIKIDVHSIKPNYNVVRYLPAFYAVFRHNRHIVTQEIKPHPVLSRLYRDAQLETLTFEPLLLPLISPPVPWHAACNGGYLVSDAKIIRLPYQAVQQWKRLESVPPQQLYPVLDCLNQLGSIPWKINNPILEIAIEIFQKGGSKVLDIPEPPTVTLPPLIIDANATKAEQNKAAKARLKEKRKKADMYSLWCDTLYRLSLANHYKDEVFWLPHSMDFRGRVYPVPPHVNHLGSDLARSLMMFALGKPLGPHGLDWLKIHLINLTGLKKRESNRDRLSYANELMPMILDSAENPLTGEKWWQQSEEPWQTLAVCIEISKALKIPNPAEYVSHFPIHQDGSCNGLQHYAALGRDQFGAVSVNLAPSPKPQDVYSNIAALVEKERKIDAENGIEIAKLLDGLIKRKVIKQTIMTTVYGVTRFGARLQIARQLQEIEFPEEHLWQGSHYLASKTFHSLREMFTSAKLIQDWLTDCARLISIVCGQNVEWVTPLGFPVVQPYNKNSRTDSNKPGQHFSMDMFERPNIMKQRNAFPPNFVHSLDSSHMMLTSLHCEHAGITFVSVHDCFWTHACTVPEMNKICREQFVSLHSQPILKNLSEFFTNKFSYEISELRNDGSVSDITKQKLNRIFKEVPKQGAFDLKKVLDSEYFFS